MGAQIDSLADLLKTANVRDSLLVAFEAEELTIDLLRSMSPRNLASSLHDLGVNEQDAARLKVHLHTPQLQGRCAQGGPPEASSSTGPTMTTASMPMVICADHGLCNRLRAILTYREVAQREHRSLWVVWQRDDQCNGNFLDCFEPIPGVRFIREPPSWCPAPPRVNHCHHLIKGTPAEVAATALLQPNHSVRATIRRRVNDLSWPFVAVHVRRTDMAVWAAVDPKGEYVQQTADDKFDAFLTAQSRCKVYVATDCAETFERYAKLYEDRVQPAAKERVRVYQRHRHRQTSLSDAAVDLFVCVHSTHFMGSYGSSFSDMIVNLRAALGIASVQDSHTVYHDDDWAARDWVGPALRELRQTVAP